MSDEEDYNSEEDEDYVPTEGDQVSEEENSGDEEDFSLLHDGDGSPQKGKKRKASGRKANSIEARKRKGGIKLDVNGGGSTTAEDTQEKEETEEEAKRRKELAEHIAKEEEEKKVQKEKKRADDLWASFMSDVKKPSPKPTGSGLASLSSQIKPSTDPKPDTAPKKPTTDPGVGGKITITKVFDFAGEEVKITKEVDANSKEAKAEQKKQEEEQKNQKEDQKKELEEKATSSSPALSLGASLGLGAKRPAVGGLGSVLSKINKKTKMGTLEKSKIDWESFKKKEGINEDLKIHNKGKQGYMERKAFLERADQRQFELERDIRLSTSSKR